MGILAFDFGGSAVKYGYWNGVSLRELDNFQLPILGKK